MRKKWIPHTKIRLKRYVADFYSNLPLEKTFFWKTSKLKHRRIQGGAQGAWAPPQLNFFFAVRHICYILKLGI